MVKLFLSLTILLLTTATGILITGQYRNRVRHLQDLIHSFDLLETEMIYRKDPLSVIAANVGKQELGLASALFSHISIQMQQHPNQDLRSLWARGVAEIYGTSSLLPPDLAVVQSYGSQLGRSDMEGQKRMVHNLRQLLEYQLTEAREVRQQKSKMVQSLATAAGILLVILLI